MVKIIIWQEKKCQRNVTRLLYHPATQWAYIAKKIPLPKLAGIGFKMCVGLSLFVLGFHVSGLLWCIFGLGLVWGFILLESKWTLGFEI